MTRAEFVESVTTFYDLVNMDSEYSCGICDDLVLGDDLADAINEDFRYNDYDWIDIRNWLNDIEEGYECYKRNGSFEYEYLTEGDFEDYKEELLRYMCDEEYIDYDEEEDDEDDEEEVYYICVDGNDVGADEQEPPEEDIGVAELFSVCNSDFRVLKQEDIKRQSADEVDEAPEFDSLFW